MQNPVRNFTVRIPTKPYIRKFIGKMYGTPITLSYWNPLATFVLSLLDKERFDINMNSEKTRSQIASFTDEILFCAPMKTMYYKGHSIDPNKIIAVNRFLDDLFARVLCQYCQLNVSDGKTRYDQAIVDFMRGCEIEIDQDITMDALKKIEYRYRKKQEEFLQTFVLNKTEDPYSSKSRRYI